MFLVLQSINGIRHGYSCTDITFGISIRSGVQTLTTSRRHSSARFYEMESVVVSLLCQTLKSCPRSQRAINLLLVLQFSALAYTATVINNRPLSKVNPLLPFQGFPRQNFGAPSVLRPVIFLFVGGEFHDRQGRRSLDWSSNLMARYN